MGFGFTWGGIGFNGGRVGFTWDGVGFFVGWGWLYLPGMGLTFSWGGIGFTGGWLNLGGGVGFTSR